MDSVVKPSGSKNRKHINDDETHSVANFNRDQETMDMYSRIMGRFGI